MEMILDTRVRKEVQIYINKTLNKTNGSAKVSNIVLMLKS